METPHKDNDCERQLMENVETDEFQRRALMAEFASWRRRIRPLYEVLGTEPDDSPFGRLIKCGVDLAAKRGDEDEDPFLQQSTTNLIPRCEELYHQLTEQVQARKREASTIWNELQGLWKELESKEEFALCFSNAEIGIINTLRELKAHYNTRKVVKSQKLSEFIGELRQEIADIWDQCMITDEEKAQFVEFRSCEFTEEMMEIHKEELGRWKIYHKKNQEILLKIKKRDTMWKRLRELEAKASDPARFVNRGGSLLKDQNMHNYILKYLPKLEAELISLAQKFETEHGKKMRILGQEIPVMIEKEWQQFKEEKSGRKGRTAPSPRKSTLQSIRQSIAPSSKPPGSSVNTNPPLAPLLPRPGEKRFGSKLDLNATNAKKAKVQPLKAVQNDQQHQ